jgi:hypothetical protein
MNARRFRKPRMIADFVFVCAFGLVAPVSLAPISRSWGVMLVGFATFFVAAGFLLDALRTLQRWHKPDSN